MRLLRGGTISRLETFRHTYLIAVVSPRGFLCPTVHARKAWNPSIAANDWCPSAAANGDQLLSKLSYFGLELLIVAAAIGKRAAQPRVKFSRACLLCH
jgi:hypothetical protein